MFSFLLFISQFPELKTQNRKCFIFFFRVSISVFLSLLFAEKRKEEKEKRKQSVTDCFQVPFSHVHMTKKRKNSYTENRNVKCYPLLYFFYSFSHFSLYEKHKTEVAVSFTVVAFQDSLSMQRFSFPGTRKKMENNKRKMKTVSVIVFFHRKTERKKNGKRLPLFPFCFIFRFPLFIY